MQELAGHKPRLTVRLIGALVGVWMAATQPGVAQAETRPDVRAQILSLQQDLRALASELVSDPQIRQMPMDALRRKVGLDPLLMAPPTSPVAGVMPSRAVPDGPASAQMMNFRLALAMLSQSYSGKDNLDVLLAQPGGRTDAMGFRDGLVTLADIQRETARIAPSSDGSLRAPVILWEDTVLRLGPQDQLALSREDGAFLISFGRVEVVGSTLSGVGDANSRSPDFEPFVTIGGGGSLRMRGAQVRDLGFGKTPKFSGLSVAANPLMRNTGETLIEQSHFEGLTTLSIVGKTGAVVRSNSFTGMRDNALRFETAGFGTIESNLFFGPASTNAIRLLNGARDMTVAGNLIMDGERAAILVDTRSDNAIVRDNIVWNRNGGGIKFSRVHCGVAQDNVLLNSRQKGIEIRNTRETFVVGNLIGGSRNSAIWISGQPQTAVTVVAQNRMHANKAGLTMATGGAVRMEGNDFSAQMPRLLSGDIALHSRSLISDLTGAQTIKLSALGSEPDVPGLPNACRPGEGS